MRWADLSFLITPSTCIGDKLGFVLCHSFMMGRLVGMPSARRGKM